MRARFSRLAIILTLVCVVSCSENPLPTGPTAPSPQPTPSPTPTPAPTEFTLTGRVTESVPTTHTGIGGAVVKIADSARMAVTNSVGFYTIAGLPSTDFTINVSADGYVATSQRVTAMGNTKTDVQLRPIPETLTHTSSSTISGSDGTCSDGVSQKPCRILAIPVHNTGPIEATLTWESISPADLDLSIFKTGSTTPLGRSALVGTMSEEVTANVTVGGTYEIRVTQSSGIDPVTYTVNIKYPN
ncbi:MAG TPA: carboxypeptidase regulatory-like domain-containing protein [Vicinamibacterales bacterium]